MSNKNTSQLAAIVMPLAGTVIDSAWLNDVDASVYQGQLDDGTTGASIARYLPGMLCLDW